MSSWLGGGSPETQGSEVEPPKASFLYQSGPFGGLSSMRPTCPTSMLSVPLELDSVDALVTQCAVLWAGLGRKEGQHTGHSDYPVMDLAPRHSILSFQ